MLSGLFLVSVIVAVVVNFAAVTRGAVVSWLATWKWSDWSGGTSVVAGTGNVHRRCSRKNQ